MKSNILLFAIVITLFVGLYYYFVQIENKEEYLARIKNIDQQNIGPTRIQPMPNIFVAKRYVLGDWSALESNVETKNQK